MFSIEELKAAVKGDVADDADTLERYSTDYSIFRVRPAAVAFPKDAEDVKALVKFAAEKKRKGEDISLTARSAGTDMGGGPLNDSIIVDFTRYLNRIREIGPDYAVVEPGVYFRDFEKEISARGLLFPSYPASKDLCALGGMIANNSGGEKTLAYGKTENYVEELTMVLRDGEEHVIRPLAREALAEKLKEEGVEGDLYRGLYKLLEDNYDAVQGAKPDVSKNSAGYALWNVWDKSVFDLTKLFVGAQGTLGFMTSARLRLMKAKPYSQLVVVFAKDLAPIPALVEAALPFSPESIESYDDRTLRLAVRFFPSLLRLMKGNIITLGLQFLPEIGMVLRGGIPKMVLLIMLTGDDKDELGARVKRFRDAIRKFPVQVRLAGSREEAEKYWTIRHQSFKLLHSNVKGRDAAPFVDDIIVRPEHLSDMLPEVNAVLDRYKKKLVYTIAGHPGDGNFHIIPLVDLKDPAVRELIPKVMEEVHAIVLKYGGSITAEHNDGLIRSPYLKQMYGESIYALFGGVKEIFDPLGIFNPGKKVGSDLAYGLAHIKQ